MQIGVFRYIKPLILLAIPHKRQHAIEMIFMELIRDYMSGVLTDIWFAMVYFFRFISKTFNIKAYKITCSGLLLSWM